jgi:hypothetical protein
LAKVPDSLRRRYHRLRLEVDLATILERFLTIYHEHNIGDQVFVEVKTGRYFAAEVRGIGGFPEDLWYVTSLGDEKISEDFVLSSDEKNRRQSAYFSDLYARAERQLNKLRQS